MSAPKTLPVAGATAATDTKSAPPKSVAAPPKGSASTFPAPMWPILEWMSIDGLDFSTLLRHLRVRNPYPAKLADFVNVEHVEIRESSKFVDVFERLVLDPNRPWIRGRRYRIKLPPNLVRGKDFHIMRFFAATDEKRAKPLPRQERTTNLDEFVPDKSTPNEIIAACTCHGFCTGKIRVMSEAEYRDRPLEVLPGSLFSTTIKELMDAKLLPQLPGEGGGGIEAHVALWIQAMGLEPSELDRPPYEVGKLRQQIVTFEQTGRYAGIASDIAQLVSIGAELLRLYLQLSAHEEVQDKVQRHLQKLMILIMMDDAPDTDEEGSSNDLNTADPPLPPTEEEPVMVTTNDVSSMFVFQQTQAKCMPPIPTKVKSKVSPIATQIWDIFEQFLYIPDTVDRASKLEMLGYYRQMFFEMWKTEGRTIHKFLLVALPAIKFLMMEVRERQEKSKAKAVAAAAAAAATI